MIPHIKEFPQVEVVVENQLLLDEITKIEGNIRATLVRDLKNDDITVSYRIAEESEVGKVMTRREQYVELVKNNEAIAKMQERLGLELV